MDSSYESLPKCAKQVISTVVHLHRNWTFTHNTIAVIIAETNDLVSKTIFKPCHLKVEKTQQVLVSKGKCYCTVDRMRQFLSHLSLALRF